MCERVGRLYINEVDDGLDCKARRDLYARVDLLIVHVISYLYH